jgi:hypothetical protein
MRSIWHRLLDRLAASTPILYADDIRPRDKERWDEVFSLGLLREMEPMDAVLCEECGEGHWADVFWAEPGVRACFGCPEAGVIDIGPEKLRKWQVDRRQVAALIAESLEIPFAGQGILSERLWRLGRRRIGGRFRELFLASTPDAAVAEITAAIRRSIGQAPAVVFLISNPYRAEPSGDGDLIPTAHQYVALDTVSAIRHGRVTVDMEYLEERLSDEFRPPRKAISEITTPPELGWKDVSICVFDGMLQITVGEKTIEKEYTELGVAAESQQIQLLKLFAAARGTLSTEIMQSTLDGATPAKTRVGRLRSLLQSTFPIDDDPIPNNKKDGTYSCMFRILLARDDGFPTPPGSTWIDFAFHERADGRLVINAAEKTRRRGLVAGNGTTAGEVIEATQQFARTYAVEDIVPRSPSGKASVEGSLLVALLRCGGQLNRPMGDMGMLLLAKRLREWAGLADLPITYSSPTGTWVTGFSCSSDLAPRA